VSTTGELRGSAASDPPRVSIVIPSFDGHRGGYVPRLLDSIRRQTYQNFRVEMVIGVFPQGRAINIGRSRCDGEILVILDDDSALADEHTLARLVATLDADARIGMAGASIVVLPDATPFQRRAALQFPRLNTPVVDAITDSDMACHGGCAFPMAVFDAIGGEREDLVRGLDPDLRVRLRAAGYRVVLAPQCRIHHPMPNGWRALLRTYFRNGAGSAYARRFQPDSVYETHESLHDADFRPRTSLGFRIARYPFRLAMALAGGQFMRFAGYTAYAFGYAWGWLTAKEIRPAAAA